MEINTPSIDEPLELAESIINTVREPLIVLDHDLRVVSASGSFYKVFKVNPEETVGQLIYDLGNQQWDIPKLRELLETILPQKTTFDGYEVEHDFADIGRRVMLLNARQIQRVWGKERIILLAIEDITERRQLETLLADSEKRYRRLFETANDGILLLEKNEGNIAQANPAVTSMLGYSNEEFFGKRLKDVGFPDDMGNVRELLQALEQNGIIHYNDTPIQKKTGQVFYSDIYMVDKTDLVQCNIRDITERKQAETAAREFLRNIINAIADPVFVKDDKRKFVLVNKALCAIVGRPRESLIGEDGDDMFPEEEVEVFRKIDAIVLETGKENVNEETLTNLSSGEVRTIVTRKTRYIDPAGKKFLVGVIRDITERKKAEAERERLMTAIEQGDDVVIITNADGLIQYVNPAFETVTGYTGKEALGQNPRIFKSGKQGESFYREMWDTLTSGNTFHGRMINKRKDGSLYTEDATISPVRDATGNIVNYVAVKRDVTAQIQLETQLLQAQKMESVGRLAGGVAHDYNNMLSVILGYTEMAMEQVDPNDPLYADLKEVYTAGKRSMEITGQLLAFARKQIISPVVMDLNETVDGMLKMLRRLIGEDIDFAWEPAIRLWPVNMDPSQLDQILANLCVNARDAISGVGKITIETENVNLDESYCAEHAGFIPGDFVMLAVSDNGCGMDKETMAQIFEPFYTTKDIGKGTGLGLATIYGIVKQNNGFVNVYSEPGSGTTFRIYLPRHTIETDEAIAEVTPEEVAFGQGETLLLVEDEPTIIKMCQAMLEKLGYNVLIAHAPDEAVKLASEHSGIIHLLMSDVVMPGMNGRDLADKLQAIRPDIRVLFMSGYTADIIAGHGVLDGGVHFIQKPFSMKNLSVKVREVLEGGKRS